MNLLYHDIARSYFYEHVSYEDENRIIGFVFCPYT